MRHQKAGRHLGRTAAHRKALFRNLSTDILKHGRVRTTLPKAKEVRRFVERMITLGKRGHLHARRQAAAFLKDKDVVRKLFSEYAEMFKDRPGGYTRIIKLGRRTGDGAEMALIELVEESKAKKKVTSTSPKKGTSKKAGSKGGAKKSSSGKTSSEKSEKNEGAKKKAAVSKKASSKTSSSAKKKTSKSSAKSTSSSKEKKS